MQSQVDFDLNLRIAGLAHHCSQRTTSDADHLETLESHFLEYYHDIHDIPWCPFTDKEKLTQKRPVQFVKYTGGLMFLNVLQITKPYSIYKRI